MIDVDPDAVVILSDEARRVAADLEDMKKTRKRIDERIDEATNVLRSELGAAEVGYDAPGDRKPRVSWKRQSASKLDAAALRSAMPITARKFTKSTTYRVLRTHPPKEKSHGRSRQ
jgi:predicted phage-related endonuclease